jgi:hypothetical protein
MSFRSCGDEHRLLARQALEPFARELVCRIRFTTHITNHSPASPAALTNFVHRDAKAVARRHSTAHHGRAISADDDAMMRPARGGQVERTGAHVRLQLGRTAQVRKTERFRVHSPASNKNGQAAPGPAVPVEGRVHVDHQAIPQDSIPPGNQDAPEPNTMLRGCRHPGTICSAKQGIYAGGSSAPIAW